ncbi:F-box/kelch-repeat protein [Corchorus capsularis]|uniref:F-box/kelch-repeat protein n=1 Tax=Corchorus capsularis TaxID=210143 RepID=A0A1R3ILU9_COCAP|nr:F-box/kelch-repeat protein [Corchorus capsularis]
MEGKENVDDEEEKKRCKGLCLCCVIPRDVVKIILTYLSSVKDYMSFRGVSKCWRLAFSNCAASTEFMSPKRAELPWFLVLSKKSEEKLRDYGVDYGPDWEPDLIYQYRPILHTTGKLGNISDWSYDQDQSECGCKYATHSAPELQGTRILLSRLGWLLLFNQGNNDNSSSELFFFNPFSKAKIVLPFMDVSKLMCPVFDISAPPTSPDCTILVASSENHQDEYQDKKFGKRRYIRIDMCRRGDSSWSCFFKSKHRGPAIANSFFVNGLIWYLLDSDGQILALDVANRSLRRKLEVGVKLGDHDKEDDTYYTDNKRVSYIVKRGGQVFLIIHGEWHRYEFELPKDLPPDSHHLAATKTQYSTLFLENYEQDSQYLFRVDVKKAFTKEREVVSVDHCFNMDAWCAINVGVAGNKIFPRWHRSLANYMMFHMLRKTIPYCHVHGCRSQFVMWLDPIWVEPSPNLTWN